MQENTRARDFKKLSQSYTPRRSWSQDQKPSLTASWARESLIDDTASEKDGFKFI